ncbi:MAG: PEP-CTERM-box response regulator transcription factor [Deltaproteobacteria bacterium]|nr:PEP-CTERM-box response regulator transcription factor [Deltaproteobacteria bacterium]
MNKHDLLIIEDDETISSQMKWALVDDYNVFVASGAEAAMQVFTSIRPAIVTLDLGLPPSPEDAAEGLGLLRRILRYDPVTKVIIVTGMAGRAEALKAISMGAHDLFTKPIDVEELKVILRRAYYVHTLETEYFRHQRESGSKQFGEIIGTSQKMLDVFVTVRKVAATGVPVLITGESGTGKELIARAIHNESSRRSRPFIPINCGAIPENLLETELFGHEKGAFTGAHAQRNGRIESAEGGTLFLDELGELPLALQVKLLRFLQDHKIERVGGRGALEMDVRVIAATNRGVKKLISEGRFREDLYYRLAVVTIDLPPLRERGDDLVIMAKSLLAKFSPDADNPKHLSTEAIETLKAHDWPGNVRELENRIRRAVTFAEGHLIRPSDLGFTPGEEKRETLDLKKAKEDLEVKFVQLAIQKHNGNISRAAEELGLSRPTVHSIIKRHPMLDAQRKG